MTLLVLFLAFPVVRACTLCSGGELSHPDKNVPIYDVKCSEMDSIYVQLFSEAECAEIHKGPFPSFCGCSDSIEPVCTLCPDGGEASFPIHSIDSCTYYENALLLEDPHGKVCQVYQEILAIPCGCPNVEPCTLCANGEEPENHDFIIESASDLTCSQYNENLGEVPEGSSHCLVETPITARCGCRSSDKMEGEHCGLCKGNGTTQLPDTYIEELGSTCGEIASFELFFTIEECTGGYADTISQICQCRNGDDTAKIFTTRDSSSTPAMLPAYRHEPRSPHQHTQYYYATNTAASPHYAPSSYYDATYTAASQQYEPSPHHDATNERLSPQHPPNVTNSRPRPKRPIFAPVVASPTTPFYSPQYPFYYSPSAPYISLNSPFNYLPSSPSMITPIAIPSLPLSPTPVDYLDSSNRQPIATPTDNGVPGNIDGKLHLDEGKGKKSNGKGQKGGGKEDGGNALQGKGVKGKGRNGLMGKRRDKKHGKKGHRAKKHFGMTGPKYKASNSEVAAKEGASSSHNLQQFGGNQEGKIELESDRIYSNMEGENLSLSQLLDDFFQ